MNVFKLLMTGIFVVALAGCFHETEKTVVPEPAVEVEPLAAPTDTPVEK